MGTDFITTATGKHFYFDNPDPDQIEIADIAYALSHTNRWGGHCYPAFNVAHHSILVSEALMRNGASQMVQLQGLLHDAAEAYLGDIPTPIKSRLPEYMAMELLITQQIFEKFGAVLPMDPQVHLHDVEVRRWEYRDLMPDTRAIEAPVGNRATLVPWAPRTSEEAFLGRFFDLTLALGNKEAA